jgi:hypothetical protein
MKKLFTILSFMVFVVSAVFSQTDAEFFSFCYKPGESASPTTIALGTAAQKYNIQYKKVGETTWLNCSPAEGTIATVTIPRASTADDVYDVRYRLSNTDTPADVTFDFGTDAGKLTDITQWGTKTGKVSFDFGRAAVGDPEKYTSLENISANDVVKFAFLRFRWNDVFTGTASHMDQWDVSATSKPTQDFVNMFQNASFFNGNIGNWNVSRSTNFSAMFQFATVFNQDISMWNTSNATTFNSMFNEATAFNQNISGWDVTKSKNFAKMFQSASAFNQDLSAWTPKMQGTQVPNMANMFDNSGMSRENYDKTINGWWSKKDQLPDGVTLGALNIHYRDCATARQGFITEKGWTFVGDTLDVENDVIEVINTDKVKLIGKTLVFESLPATRVLVYSLSGSLVADYAPAYKINLNLGKGFYIVKVDGYSKKIVLN